MTAHASEQLKNRIRDLWLEGHSAGQIASRVGTEFGQHRTRNSIIGIINRMGIRRAAGMKRSTRDARTANGQAADKAARSKPASAKGAALPAAAPLEIVSIVAPAPVMPVVDGGIPLIGAPNAACRYWVSGQGATLMVCGATVRPGSSYCPCHHGTAYVPPERRSRRAA
ncbi:GcrA family cell cycle regulator [Xanthobacteraceae bacterium A53D]